MKIITTTNQAASTKAKAKYVYDKYGMVDKHLIFSHFVFCKIANCVEAIREMYVEEGKVFNQLFNH
jgi:hypothetical protein